MATMQLKLSFFCTTGSGAPLDASGGFSYFRCVRFGVSHDCDLSATFELAKERHKLAFSF